MAAIPYVGATQVNANDLTTRSYVDSLLNLNLGQSAVDTLISVLYANYVLASYVQQQDQLNATKTFIDAGDATRLKLAQVGTNNGAVPLLSNGRIANSRVSAPSTQRWPKPYYSPTTTYSGQVMASTTEVQLYTYPLPDPGGTYKLLVFGLQDVFSSLDGEYAVVRVRVGSMTGPVIAGAYGLGEKYVGGVLTAFTTVGSATYTVPAFATNLDVICLGGGGGGTNGGFFIIPLNGKNGGAGTFGTATLTKGTTLPSSTTTLAITVGAGGGNSGTGGNSTVTGTGVTTVTGPGGPPGTDAASVVPITFNGATYNGAPSPLNAGDTGFSPGGGGGYGPFLGVAGGPGGGGGVFILAYSTPNAPSGPATIIPTPLNAQAPLTGAQTLYVTLQRSGSASTQTATQGITPKLTVIPLPA